MEQHRYTRDYFLVQTSFVKKLVLLSKVRDELGVKQIIEDNSALKRAFVYDKNNTTQQKQWEELIVSLSFLEEDAIPLSIILFNAYLNHLNSNDVHFPESAAQNANCVRVTYEAYSDVLHTHFVPSKIHGSGALSKENRPERFRQYQSLFSELMGRFRSDILVIGNSWLYNIESYNWLFPDNRNHYNHQGKAIDEQNLQRTIGKRIFPVWDSRNEAEDLLPNLRSWSIWGQFLNSNFEMKTPYVASFLKSVEKAGTFEELFDSFPLPVRYYSSTLQLWLVSLFEREN